MPYNKEFYGEKTKALTKSMYSQDFVDGFPPAPPQNYYLVDENENYFIDENGNYFQAVI